MDEKESVEKLVYEVKLKKLEIGKKVCCEEEIFKFIFLCKGERKCCEGKLIINNVLVYEDEE